VRERPQASINHLVRAKQAGVAKRHEVEELVLKNGSAEVHAELVAVEGRFLKGDDISCAADGGRFEVAGCTKVGIADELVDASVKAVGSAGGRDFDGGA
jgi:hypothetical protein